MIYERQYTEGNDITKGVRDLVRFGLALTGFMFVVDLPNILFKPEKSEFVKQIQEETHKKLENYTYNNLIQRTSTNCFERVEKNE